MLLNRFETHLMNNPIRSWIQRKLEARRLEDMGGRVEGKRVLEVGSGRGIGAEILLDRFGAAEVDGIDLDPKMVALARQRLASRRDQVRIAVGDVTAIEAADCTYDAVFDFGIIHHVPSWERALGEIHRVLKPGGRFFAEEVHERFILNPLWRRLLDHPTENRFDHERFASALEEQGFVLVASRPLWGWFGWYVCDKPAESSSAVG